MKIADYYRRQNRKSEKIGFTDASEQIAESRLNEWTSAESSIEKEEFWQVLNACVDKLPDTVGTAYLMRELDGQSVDQVCDTLRITAKNLAVRLFRARALLRDCLEKNWFHRDSGDRHP